MESHECHIVEYGEELDSLKNQVKILHDTIDIVDDVDDNKVHKSAKIIRRKIKKAKESVTTKATTDDDMVADKGDLSDN